MIVRVPRSTVVVHLLEYVPVILGAARLVEFQARELACGAGGPCTLLENLAVFDTEGFPVRFGLAAWLHVLYLPRNRIENRSDDSAGRRPG